MGRIQSLEDLMQAKEEAIKSQVEKEQGCKYLIRISNASCGVAAGALDALARFHELLSRHNSEQVCIQEIGCLGLCSLEPIVQVQEKDRALITYGKVTRFVAQRIIHEHIGKGLPVQEYVIELT